MLNLLEYYIPESLPRTGSFNTNPNLWKKVGADGNFLPYYGNTVVFQLPEDTKVQLEQLQHRLYAAAGSMLAQPICPGTFHMTLHDLVNGPEEAALRGPILETETAARQIIRQYRGQPPLRMQGTWMFNMVNTSIVLGLKPADGDSWRRLDQMYMALETVVPLGYGLTPHITLAYFRPGRYEQEELLRLKEALGPVELDLELTMEGLEYTRFTDMNTYGNSDKTERRTTHDHHSF